jgi:xanthine dehydrogenase YagR molybdenum-binding subunit
MALLVEEQDPHVNALGIRRVGGMAITGAGGAATNAVWHAAGMRARRFPTHLEDMLPVHDG